MNRKSAKRIIITLFCVIVSVALLATYHLFGKHYFEIDKCLDSGGRWDYFNNCCDHVNVKNAMQYYEFPKLTDTIPHDFKESLEKLFDLNKRIILKDTIIVEILDSLCQTPHCGYVSFGNAVRTKIENGDTIVMVTLCLGDITSKVSDLQAQFRPGGYVQYANNELPEFSVHIEQCKTSGDLRSFNFTIAKPIGHP